MIGLRISFSGKYVGLGLVKG